MTDVSHAQPTPTEDKAASISADIQRFADLGLLDMLLLDRSTGGNIIWACKSYESLGAGYGEHDEIRAEAITGENVHVLRTRARKEQMERAALTKAHAEVFTPSWICKMMIDHADEAWYAEIDDSENAWETYITSPRLEITCGEAPYLVNRYDAADGSAVPTTERIGILGRKLALAVERAKERDAWVNLALAACKSVYGYEFQGDNLLIARINVLCTMEDFVQAAGFAPFTQDEYRQIAEIISWNIWQMDGITDCVPFGKEPDPVPELRLPGLEDLFAEEDGQLGVPNAEGRGPAVIYDWKNNAEVEFRSLKRKGSSMKFDYVIGNPPYQDEAVGEQKQFAPPIYHQFMDGAYSVGRFVELIHPARFLFNAGGTPKEWNKKMLDDPHFKVLFHEQDSSKVFKGTDIKGGVVITCRDSAKNYGAIGIYTAFEELNGILRKVKDRADFEPFSDLIHNRGLYRFADKVYDECPEEMSKISDSRIGANSFERLASLFFADKPSDEFDYVQFLGLLRGKREYRWFRRDYFKPVESFEQYKVIVPAANGSGALGEVLSTPLIGRPLIGHTETFLSIGGFASEDEAQACLKYVKGKFARTLLGVLKITQHNSSEKWAYVPLQDFTPTSDIDWSQSVADIDRQLYAKYGLSQEEIDFIESHVQEMS